MINAKRMQVLKRKETGSVIKVTKVNQDGSYTVGNVINGAYDKSTSRVITQRTMNRWYQPV